MINTIVDVAGFTSYMIENEKAGNTIEKYAHTIREMGRWAELNCPGELMDEEKQAKNIAVAYKNHLRHSGLKPSSVNVKLAGVNLYLEYLGYPDRVKYIRMQRKIFTEKSRELSQEEYKRLVNTARKRGNERIALVMETMASTGMRVSELQYVTVESLKNRKVEVDMKNKVRVIFLPQKLCFKLYMYAAENGIAHGNIFVTTKGEPISRKQIWNEMKRVSDAAGVDESKVYPHNLRHVFARTYYKQCKDLARLADVLGHTSLETTRIYLMESGDECEKMINNLNLVC